MPSGGALAEPVIGRGGGVGALVPCPGWVEHTEDTTD